MKLVIEVCLNHYPEERETYGVYGELNSPYEPDYFEVEDIKITQGPKDLPLHAIVAAIEETANENKQLLKDHGINETI